MWEQISCALVNIRWFLDLARHHCPHHCLWQRALSNWGSWLHMGQVREIRFANIFFSSAWPSCCGAGERNKSWKHFFLISLTLLLVFFPGAQFYSLRRKWVGNKFELCFYGFCICIFVWNLYLCGWGRSGSGYGDLPAFSFQSPWFASRWIVNVFIYSLYICSRAFLCNHSFKQATLSLS